MFAVTGRSRLKDFSRMASGKPGPSKDGRHASFNMKSITLTDGYLPIACFQEPSHRQSRTVQVLRPTYSNASPFRSNRPRKNEGRHMAFGAGPHMCLGLNLARLAGPLLNTCAESESARPATARPAPSHLEPLRHPPARPR